MIITKVIIKFINPEEYIPFEVLQKNAKKKNHPSRAQLRYHNPPGDPRGYGIKKRGYCGCDPQKSV